MSDKQPTQGERIEALEEQVEKLTTHLAAVRKALTSADPTLIAVELAD